MELFCNNQKVQLASVELGVFIFFGLLIGFFVWVFTSSNKTIERLDREFEEGGGEEEVERRKKVIMRVTSSVIDTIILSKREQNELLTVKKDEILKPVYHLLETKHDIGLAEKYWKKEILIYAMSILKELRDSGKAELLPTDLPWLD